jgi:hypothetical protein
MALCRSSFGGILLSSARRRGDRGADGLELGEELATKVYGPLPGGDGEP